jgi:hypothetical protein
MPLSIAAETRVDPDAARLVRETAPDNVVAQRIHDSLGAEKSSWLTCELDV